MMSMYKAATTSSTAIKFRSDFLRREIEVEFQIIFRDMKDSIPVTTDGTTAERPGRIQDYVFTIPFAQTTVLHDVGSEGKSALLLSLDNPPNFYRKYDAEFTHDLEATFWSRRNTLFRQTDITFDPRKLRQEPITLKKARSIIDIGELSNPKP
jgi:RNA-dependent RNA polymerase